MRKTFVAAAALTSVALLAGCAATPSSQSASSHPAGQTVCVGTPKVGGSVVYDRQLETQSLNPLAIRNGNADIIADQMIYNGLVQYDPTGSGKIVPALAASWTVSPDGLTYTFTLRPGVKFSDGSPVTAADVKFSLDRFGDPDINTTMGAVAVGYGTSKVLADDKISFTLTAPTPGFLDGLSIFPAYIVPKDLVQSEGETAFFQHPVGTGAFTVKDFVSGSHITFVKNPNYWESGKPYLDSVTFNFATDNNSRVLALKSGAAQLADGIPFSQYASLKATSNISVDTLTVPASIQLFLNSKTSQLADVKVRQAMQYALNRDVINKALFAGEGSIPNSIMPQLNLDSKTVKGYSFNLSKAKALMAASKYPSGFTISLQYPSGFDYYDQLVVLMQQEYAAIGIKLKLEKLDAATIANNLGSASYDLSFPFPQFTSDVLVPDELASFYADPSNGTDGFFTAWSDPSITAMVKQFTSSTSATERSSLWPKLQKAFLDQTPVINVIDTPYINAHQSNVCGADVNALGVDQLQNTWLTGASK